MDIERLIRILVTPYIDPSNPLMHSDELQAECWAKLAQILDGGHLRKCKSRGKAFGFIKTSFRNHLRSLVHKYAFTEKRTGVKPPPKREKLSEKQIDSTPTRSRHVYLDDQEHPFQIGRFDSAFQTAEYLEALEQELTEEEKRLFPYLIRSIGFDAELESPVMPESKFRSLAANIRSKARAVLQNRVVAQSSNPKSEENSSTDRAKRQTHLKKVVLKLPLKNPIVRIAAMQKRNRRISHPTRKKDRNRKIHVISFRLTDVEMQALQRRSPAFKSASRTARAIVVAVLRSERAAERAEQPRPKL